MRKLLLIGDSLTMSVGAYPVWLQPQLSQHELIGSQGVAPVLHEGYTGKTWAWHLATGPTADVPAFVAAYGAPDTVVCLLGTNDLAGVTIANQPATIAAMMIDAAAVVAAWQAIGATVYVCHVPGPCQYDAAYAALGAVRADWESAVGLVNAAYDGAFSTITVPGIESDWPVDNCYHPNAQGYARIAGAVAAGIGETVGRSVCAARPMVRQAATASAKFDGVWDCVIGTNPLAGAGDYTLAVWTKVQYWPGARAIDCIMCSGAKAANGGAYIGTYTAAGTLRNYLIATTYGSVRAKWECNRLDWMRVVYTCESGVHRLYVDGVKVAESAPGNPDISGASTHIGMLSSVGTNWNPYRGWCHDSSVWTRAWSAAEVAADYRAEAVSTAGRARRWMLDAIAAGKTVESILGTSDFADFDRTTTVIPFGTSRAAVSRTAAAARSVVP